MWSHGGEGHKSVGVEPAFVISLFELGESGAVAMEEGGVHLFELDEDVGQEGFLGEEGEALASFLVVVSN